MKYARNVDGSWIDVYEVPSNAFADAADLERKIGVTGFVAVDDAVKHGDFVVGDAGFSARPVVEPVTQELQIAPEPTKSEILAKLQELVDAVSALPDEEEAP